MKEIRLTSPEGIKRLAEILKGNEVKWLAIYLNSSPYLKKKRPKFHQKVVFSVTGNPKLPGVIVYVYPPYHLEFWESHLLPDVELESGYWNKGGFLEVTQLTDNLVVLTPKEEA